MCGAILRECAGFVSVLNSIRLIFAAEIVCLIVPTFPDQRILVAQTRF